MTVNALYLKETKITSLPQLTMRLANVEVYDFPKFISTTPSIKHHWIYIKEHDLRLPLWFEGIVYYFTVHIPSEEEMKIPPWPSAWYHANLWCLGPHMMENINIRSSTYWISGEELKERQCQQFILSEVISRGIDQGTFCEYLNRKYWQMGASVYTRFTPQILTPELSKIWFLRI